MLVDYEYANGQLITSYINSKGQLKLKYFPWSKPTKFIIVPDSDPDRHEHYVTWDGKSTKEIFTKYPNRYSVYDFLDKLPEEDQKILFDYNDPDTFFIDIETEITDQKMQPQLANSRIISIAIVHKEKALVMSCDPLTTSEISDIETDINNLYGKKFKKQYTFQYNYYDSEFVMLKNFFHGFLPKMPVISGWNVISFDWVFLVNRFRNIGGDPTVASLTGNLRKPYQKKKTDIVGTRKIEKEDFSEMPAHKLIVDYMDLYKKWDTSVKVKESDDLNFVAGEILGEQFGKVSYVGDLKYLYKTDKKKFMFYNVIDTILVQLIHEKQQYMNILYSIGCLAKITLPSALTTLTVTEGILRSKLRTQKNIVLCKIDKEMKESTVGEEEGLSGGYVLPPVRGMCPWTTCYDFSSLYPTTIRQFNISADCYKGQVPHKKVGDKKVYDMKSKYSMFNGQKIDLDDDDIVLLTGSVFRNTEGVVSQVMREIFSDRKKYKKMMMVEHEKLDDLKRKKQELEDSL